MSSGLHVKYTSDHRTRRFATGPSRSTISTKPSPARGLGESHNDDSYKRIRTRISKLKMLDHGSHDIQVPNQFPLKYRHLACTMCSRSTSVVSVLPENRNSRNEGDAENISKQDDPSGDGQDEVFCNKSEEEGWDTEFDKVGNEEIDSWGDNGHFVEDIDSVP